MSQGTDHDGIATPDLNATTPVKPTKRVGNPWLFWVALSVAIVLANIAKAYHVPTYLISVPLIGTDILSPAVDFVVTTTQGLVVILLLSIYFNYFDRPRIERELGEIRLRLPVGFSQKVAHDHATLEKGLKQLTLDSVRRQAQALKVSEAVAERYPRALRTESLVNMILPGTPAPFVTTDILIRLQDLPGDGSYYKFTGTYRYYELEPSESETEYVAGIATNVDLAIKVQMERSIFKEVFHTSKLTQFPSVSTTLGLDLDSLQAEWRSADSPDPQFSKFRRIEDDDAIEKYLGRLKDHAGEVQIYVATIGRRASYASFRFTIVQEKNANAPFCQWQTYLPTYLRQFEFDAHDFTWKGTRPQFHWSPFFFASLGKVHDDIEKGAFKIPVHSWLVGGQGAVVLWSADGTTNHIPPVKPAAQQT